MSDDEQHVAPTEKIFRNYVPRDKDLRELARGHPPAPVKHLELLKQWTTLAPFDARAFASKVLSRADSDDDDSFFSESVPFEASDTWDLETDLQAQLQTLSLHTTSALADFLALKEDCSDEES